MQGTFETHPSDRNEHNTLVNIEEMIEPPENNRASRMYTDAIEASEQVSSSANTLPKRVRLGTIANVPWNSLAPENDKATQQRMRDHRIQQAKYESLTDDRKQYIPKVNPYPEAPDCVFPGTPCYKIMVNGVNKTVFVIDPASPGYDRNWDGNCRHQSTAWWIVPHFIFRDENTVALAKSRWMTVYDLNTRAGIAPEGKTDYDSRILAAPLPAGAPAFPPGVVGPGMQNDCYYVEGVTNPDANAPTIEDPLFSLTFNTNPLYAGGRQIRPFPYQQDSNIFPQRPAPPPVFRPPAVPGAPAAAPGPAAAPAPAAAGRGRGRGRGVLQQIPPHPTLLAVEPAQNLRKGRNNVDWIEMNINNPNIEISMDVLKTTCEQAEELDYAFALSMQGLRGANLSAVWTCTDPEYDVTDRSVVMAQFVRTYMEKFYQHVNVASSTDVEEVVHEALRMHEEFCKGWVSRHHRTLSSEITAASEALVGLFMDDMKPLFPQNINISRNLMSRYLRRHPDYCGEFAHCLYHYMTSTEHMRGNRNPSYKAMNNERAAHITALKKMGELLFTPTNQDKIKQYIRNLDNNSIIFDKFFIDWHLVAAQMPQHHKEFDGYANNFSLFRSRTGGRGNPFPPWQQMRRV